MILKLIVQVSKRDKIGRFSHSASACEMALKCVLTLNLFIPERMFNQQYFLNVSALAVVYFDICE